MNAKSAIRAIRYSLLGATILGAVVFIVGMFAAASASIGGGSVTIRDVFAALREQHPWPRDAASSNDGAAWLIVGGALMFTVVSLFGGRDDYKIRNAVYEVDKELREVKRELRMIRVALIGDRTLPELPKEQA